MATVIGYALLDTLGGVLVSPSAAVSARMRKQDPGNYIYLREDLLRRYGKNMPLRQVCEYSLNTLSSQSLGSA